MITFPAAAAEPLCNSLSGLGNAAEALRRGDVTAAVLAAQAAREAIPRGRPGARAAASLGLALLEARRPAEAVEPLRAALAAPPPGTEGALDLALGRALLESGRPGEALAPLDRAARQEATGAGQAARWLEAEALLAAGRLNSAIQRHEALLVAGAGDEATSRRGRFLLAGALRLTAREGDAIALYRALAVEEADSPEGAESAAALLAWVAAGAERARLSTGDRMKRFERLLQRGRGAEALVETELAEGTSPPAPAEQVALLRALALASLGRLGEAVDTARPLASGPDPGVRRGARWVLARAAAREGRTEEATGQYAAVAESAVPVPGLGEARSRDLGDEAAYLAAWLWYDGGRYRTATARLDAFVRGRPASPRADDARWFAAWASFRAGDRWGAQVRLARLERGPLADAALYWTGRLGGASPAARERLRRASELGGDGWYGWLARRRLERLGPSPTAAAPALARPAAEPVAAAPPPDAPTLERLRLAGDLLALGWRDGALRQLEALASRGAPRTTALELCRLASFAGEPALALRVARDLLGQGRGSDRWLFPAAYEELVAASARDAGVDEALLLAVVRRESRFVPQAVSSAGARGLAQLLPRTASRLGFLARLGADPASRLGDPATNLPLAALYLGLLRDRFGSDAGALAAYNAGPTAPAAWGERHAGQALDEWVENVPFKETRSYLKNVLAAREVYRRRSGQPPLLDPAAPVPAPSTGVAF